MKFRYSLYSLREPVGVPDYLKKYTIEEIREDNLKRGNIFIPTKGISYDKVKKLIDICKGQVVKVPAYELDYEHINLNVLDSAGIDVNNYEDCEFIYGIDESAGKYKIYAKCKEKDGFCEFTANELCGYYIKGHKEAIALHGELISRFEGDVDEYFKYLTEKNLHYKTFEVRFGSLPKRDMEYLPNVPEVRKFLDSRIENKEDHCIVFEREPYIL